MFQSSIPALARQQHLTKREIAVAAIRNGIEIGKYTPGQIISQRELVDDLGLGVTPIREAIIELLATNMVIKHSHHSIRIAEVTETHLRDLFEVRHMLEKQAITLVVTKVTDDLIRHLSEINDKLRSLIDTELYDEINDLDRTFHESIFSSCGNEALFWTINQVKASFPMYALWQEKGRLHQSVEEHQDLINALASQDIAKCVQAQRTHLVNGLNATMAHAKTTGYL